MRWPGLGSRPDNVTAIPANATISVRKDFLVGAGKNRTASPDLFVAAKGALRRFPGNAAGRESVCCSVGWGDHECKTQERRKKKHQTSLGQERCVGVGKAIETSARCAEKDAYSARTKSRGQTGRAQTTAAVRFAGTPWRRQSATARASNSRGAQAAQSAQGSRQIS